MQYHIIKRTGEELLAPTRQLQSITVVEYNRKLLLCALSQKAVLYRMNFSKPRRKEVAQKAVLLFSGAKVCEKKHKIIFQPGSLGRC